MVYVLTYIILCLFFTNFVHEHFKSNIFLSIILTIVWPFVCAIVIIVVFLNFAWDFVEFLLGVKS